ncbi:MAG: hypothetical protein HY548_03750 [Elusimicrobia bacterium]|nr:hypothetical protein [Elusimicrobiota bacterium]
MRHIVISVLLSGFVWPGAGQLYNREFRKGVILISLTFLVSLSLLLGAGVEVARNLPPDLSMFDTSHARAITEKIMLENAGFFMTFQVLVLAIWGYGVIDAFLGARERQKTSTPVSAPPSEPS